MISKILQRHDEAGFKKVIELILNATISEEKQSYHKINIDHLLYFNNLSYSVNYFDEENNNDGINYFDGLNSILQELKNLGVIRSFEQKIYKNNDYDKYDFLSDYYRDPEGDGVLADSPDIDLVSLYFKNGGEYYISCDQKKVKLFHDIIFTKKKYIIKIESVKKLINLIKSYIDAESLIDWLELSDEYVFHDDEVLLCSIASSNRLNIAKMYYYFSKHISDYEWNNFIEGPLDFETEVLMSNNANFDFETHTEGYREFWFNPLLDNEFNHPKKKGNEIIRSGEISYDFDKMQLKIGDKHIAFKSAKKARDLLEYLLSNSSRYVTGTEVQSIRVTDLKMALDDLKKKLKTDGVPVLYVKQLFNYFVEKEEKYCRILL